jgi:hypothetical protein
MGIISRQIGWSQESNLLWQILKQLNRLTSIMFGLKPKYKVYTALLTQSGGDNPLSINTGILTIGVTYFIDEVFENSGADFFNVGAPNNNVGTFFIATGTTPNSWGEVGSETTLIYNQGAPVVTVLENTIGNIWFIYNTTGEYEINSSSLFLVGKTWGICPANTGQGYTNVFGVNDANQIYLATSDASDTLVDDLLSDTSIEIRVYN